MADNGQVGGGLGQLLGTLLGMKFGPQYRESLANRQFKMEKKQAQEFSMLPESEQEAYLKMRGRYQNPPQGREFSPTDYAMADLVRAIAPQLSNQLGRNNMGQNIQDILKRISDDGLMPALDRDGNLVGVTQEEMNSGLYTPYR